MKTTRIRKASLRQQVYASLFRLLVLGRWAPGERWNDSALAAELGVSRTPVREALIQMEAEGLLACDPNRGFYLPALEREEAREIYPILWSLEQLAIFISPSSAGDLRKRLDQISSRPAASHTAADMAAAVKHDRAWHLALVAASANSRLAGLHQRLEAVSRRYAAELPPDASFAERCARDHTQILDALAGEQPARAHALLKMHWRAEMDAVLRTLDAHRPQPSSSEHISEPAAARRSRSASAGFR